MTRGALASAKRPIIRAYPAGAQRGCYPPVIRLLLVPASDQLAPGGDPELCVDAPEMVTDRPWREVKRSGYLLLVMQSAARAATRSSWAVSAPASASRRRRRPPAAASSPRASFTTRSTPVGSASASAGREARAPHGACPSDAGERRRRRGLGVGSRCRQFGEDGQRIGKAPVGLAHMSFHRRQLACPSFSCARGERQPRGRELSSRSSISARARSM